LSEIKKESRAGSWWLTPVIPATQEAEIRRIEVQSQPWANSSRDPMWRKPIANKGLTDCLRLVEHLASKHEFKPQYHQKKKREREREEERKEETKG
jgi:hypothetical protein